MMIKPISFDIFLKSSLFLYLDSSATHFSYVPTQLTAQFAEGVKVLLLNIM